MRQAPLIAGLALSLLAHAITLGPALDLLQRPAPSMALVAQERFLHEQVRDPVKRMEEAIAPGIDEPTPSTTTWVGFRDYQQHIARLAEADQAAFTEAAAAAPSEPTEVEPAPAESADVVEPADGEREGPGKDAVPTGVDTAMEFEPESAAAMAATDAGDEAVAPDSGAPFTQWLAAIAETARRLSERVAEGTTDDATARAAAETQSATPSPNEPEIGEPSDRQSDPTSTIELMFDRIDPGRPVARPGIEIRPRRPEFTDLTLLTSGAGNPLVQIDFGRDGRPKVAKILETSRDSRIDQSVLSSLYRWRASGERIAALAGDETLSLTVRIVWRAR